MKVFWEAIGAFEWTLDQSAVINEGIRREMPVKIWKCDGSIQQYGIYWNLRFKFNCLSICELGFTILFDLDWTVSHSVTDLLRLGIWNIARIANAVHCYSWLSGNKDCHEFRFSIVISVSNVTSPLDFFKNCQNFQYSWIYRVIFLKFIQGDSF